LPPNAYLSTFRLLDNLAILKVMRPSLAERTSGGDQITNDQINDWERVNRPSPSIGKTTVLNSSRIVFDSIWF
ncbi:MAG: hypothetical protein OEQ53_21825, partial [Saprospiraceae bacterium]|nr:hypothetical protein [Saprospiraceae bacterium]